jgi:hypothetical protein
MNVLEPPVAKVLPAEARALLQRAAQTVVHPRDPMARERAIDRAIAHIKLQYPQFFKE